MCMCLCVLGRNPIFSIDTFAHRQTFVAFGHRLVTPAPEWSAILLDDTLYRFHDDRFQYLRDDSFEITFTSFKIQVTPCISDIRSSISIKSVARRTFYNKRLFCVWTFRRFMFNHSNRTRAYYLRVSNAFIAVFPSFPPRFRLVVLSIWSAHVAICLCHMVCLVRVHSTISGLNVLLRGCTTLLKNN